MCWLPGIIAVCVWDDSFAQVWSDRHLLPWRRRMHWIWSRCRESEEERTRLQKMPGSRFVIRSAAHDAKWVVAAKWNTEEWPLAARRTFTSALLENQSATSIIYRHKYPFANVRDHLEIILFSSWSWLSRVNYIQLHHITDLLLCRQTDIALSKWQSKAQRHANCL